MILTNATFAAAAPGFGQQLAGGSGTASLSMPAGDFTLDVWFTGPAVPSNSFHVMAEMFAGTTYTGYIALDTNGRLNGGVGPGTNTTPGVAADGTLHLLSVDYDSAANAAWLYLDGVPTPTSAPGSIAAATSINLAAAGGTTGGFDGWGSIADVRVSKVKRYGGVAFTPPTGPFTSDANTVFLAHLDGPGTP